MDTHKYGKARECESCHTKEGEQRQEVSWKYADAGADPFDGKHVVIANKEGLFIKDMQAVSEIKVKEGWKVEDFAPWHYLKDKWQVKGDFSVPPIKNRETYEKELNHYEDIIRSKGIYHN